MQSSSSKRDSFILLIFAKVSLSGKYRKNNFLTLAKLSKRFFGRREKELKRSKNEFKTATYRQKYVEST